MPRRSSVLHKSAGQPELAQNLPTGWSLLPFPEAIHEARARVAKVPRASYQKTGQYPIIDQGQDFIAGYWDAHAQVHREPLPVIVFGDHTRIFKFIDFPFVAGADGTQILVPRTNHFDPFFLYLALSALNIPNRGYNRHFSLLKEQSIVQPPLPEQRAIASVLRTILKTRKACETAIDATKRCKASLLTHLFKYGPASVHEADQIALKETADGEVPEHWQQHRVRDLGHVITGKTPPTSKPEYWDGTIPFITPADLTDSIIHAAGRTISEAGLAVVKELRRGAVVVSCIGYIGKVGLVDCARCATNQQINALIPTAHHDSGFLFYRFQTLRPRLEAAAAITTVPILNKSNFEGIATWVPEFAEQQVIAAYLSALDEKLTAEVARHAALVRLFDSLLHHLMTGKARLPEFVNTKQL